MSSMEDTILAATEANINALIGGGSAGFTGLGSMAKQTIMYAGMKAHENAVITVGDKTVRNSEKYTAMERQLQEQFVMAVLGFNGQPPVSVQEATRQVVERVYDLYLEWARAAA